MNVLIILCKIANVYLDISENIIRYLDLRVLPNLTAPIVRGMDWLMQYNRQLIGKCSHFH